MLAESHLAIHTWPERQGLTLDVYVCNYSADNSAKARKLFDQLVDYFQPTEAARHEVDRGEHLLMEPLNDSTGFYIKATKQLGEWQTRFQKMAIYETPHYGKTVPPRRVQHDLREGGVRLSREPDPPRADGARRAARRC